jgi:hypothetical protein
MSKRHQSSRRRSYGRRQHEVHERDSRRHAPLSEAYDLETWDETPQPDPLAFLDPRSPRLRYALGE